MKSLREELIMKLRQHDSEMDAYLNDALENLPHSNTVESILKAIADRLPKGFYDGQFGGVDMTEGYNQALTDTRRNLGMEDDNENY